MKGIKVIDGSAGVQKLNLLSTEDSKNLLYGYYFINSRHCLNCYLYWRPHPVFLLFLFIYKMILEYLSMVYWLVTRRAQIDGDIVFPLLVGILMFVFVLIPTQNLPVTLWCAPPPPGLEIKHHALQPTLRAEIYPVYRIHGTQLWGIFSWKDSIL